MSDDTVVTPALLRQWPLPQPEGDKHSRGTVLVVGGAVPTVGAVILAGIAALRAGAGVLQICCDPHAATAVAVAVPEARVVGWSPKDAGDLAADADAILVGPGLDDVDHTAELLRTVGAAAPGAALVVDAYGIAAVSRQPELISERPSLPVLTPNAKEAA